MTNEQVFLKHPQVELNISLSAFFPDRPIRNSLINDLARIPAFIVPTANPKNLVTLSLIILPAIMNILYGNFPI